MPWYRITIRLKNGKLYRGVRQIDLWNIDTVYNHVKKKADRHFGNQVKDFDVAMISKNAAELKNKRKLK